MNSLIFGTGSSPREAACLFTYPMSTMWMGSKGDHRFKIPLICWRCPLVSQKNQCSKNLKGCPSDLVWLLKRYEAVCSSSDPDSTMPAAKIWSRNGFSWAPIGLIIKNLGDDSTKMNPISIEYPGLRPSLALHIGTNLFTFPFPEESLDDHRHHYWSYHLIQPFGGNIYQNCFISSTAFLSYQVQTSF